MYWTHRVDHPMRHETKEDAIAYLSSYITQLPPKMNDFLLELHKQDFGDFAIQTSIQEENYLEGESVYIELSKSEVKNDKLYESHEIEYSYQIGSEKDKLKEVREVVENSKVFSNVSLMVASEVREFLKQMDTSDDYNYTYNDDRVQVLLKITDSVIRYIAVRLNDNLYECYLNTLDSNKQTPLDAIENILNKIKSSHVNRIEGKLDFNNGVLGDFDLDEFLYQMERRGEEIVIHVKDKEPVEQDIEKK